MTIFQSLVFTLAAGICAAQNLPVKWEELTAADFAKAVQQSLLMGETEQSHTGMFMIMQAFIGALMAAKDNWPLQEKLMASLVRLFDNLGKLTPSRVK